MKSLKITYPLLAVAFGAMLSGCDDQVMEWKEGDSSITINDIPLQLSEKIANYDYIKNYAAKYHPNLNIACGVGADYYVGNSAYKQVVDDNFTGITLGNAMKHQSMVSATGKLDFTTVDAVLAALPSDMKLYGHNFIWHTQQQQSYLKSLIAPEMVVVTDSDSGIANVLGGDSSDFEGGTKGGWGSWGNSSETGVTSPGRNSEYCMYLMNPSDANFWSAQCAYTFDEYLDPETTYKIRFYVKSESGMGQVQFQYQNGSTYGSQGAYTTFDAGKDWTLCEVEFTPAYEDVNRIIINFGQVADTYYVDDIEFGTPQANDIINVLAGDATDFEGGSKGAWGSWGNSSETGVTSPGRNSDYCMYLMNPSDANFWSAQCAYTFDDYLDPETTYKIRFWAKCETAGGQVQFQYQNGSTYGSQGAYTTFDLGTDWIECEVEFQPAYDDVNCIIINFGQVANTYYVDDIEFGPKVGEAANAPRRATTITYKLKTPEEKREALLGAMEDWIKQMAEHVGDRVDAWDVINEPINDGGGWRGIDGKFGGSWTEDDVTYYDSEPVETEEDGLTLNWGNSTGNGHFYWGYYIGKDYGVKAFEYARKYAPNAKLFVNDYNLETSPTKLATLIEFVNYIDQNGAHVDGIGTQMHVSSSITKEQVDAMFKTMAATGKLVRITELDVQVGTSSPTAAQLQTQAECYEMILNSYFENVPEAQQSAITIWGLSDAADEHTYWLSGDCPNIFDANYGRKHAYKGVCDGLAGYDISSDFTGSDWSSAQ